MKEFNFVKIKNFCSVKVNVNSMTRKDTDWEKKIAKFISEIGSVIHTIQKNRQTDKQKIQQRENKQPN